MARGWYTWFRYCVCAADVLWMSVVHGMRGVGEVCEMCMCLARGGVGGEEGDCMRELGFGFTNPVRTGRVLDLCLCVGCGGVGGKGVGDWSSLEWWCVCVRCKSGFSV